MTVPLPPTLRYPRDHPAFTDTECFPNYWLLKIRPQGGEVITFRLLEGQRFSDAQLAAIVTLLDHFCIVTFFGRGYDQWMMGYATMGASPSELKVINDRMIVKDPITGARERGWELGLGDCEIRNHIDIAEVCPGAGSQKQYAGRTHARTMRDLPYDPGDWLDQAQMDNVDTYCENDLDVLEHLFNQCAPLLKIRERLSARYGMDMRSKSDAQLAEAILKKRCEDALGGQRLYKPRVPDFSPLAFRVPDFISFSMPELQHVLNVVRTSVFMIGAAGNVLTPEAMDNLVIRIGAGSYKIGIGGLHSQESKVSYRADEHTVIRDIDVASYYPSLIINSGEYPPALGQQFQSAYVSVKEDRLKAKALEARLTKRLTELEKELHDAQAPTTVSSAQ